MPILLKLMTQRSMIHFLTLSHNRKSLYIRKWLRVRILLHKQKRS